MGENGSKSATVETLTAEVRVLMVGSRQVTLSVFNQLDGVACNEIEPFGRVNPKDADRWVVWVVGRDCSDGTLVRAWTISSNSVDKLELSGKLRDHNGKYFTPVTWGDEDAAVQKRRAREWEGLPLIVLAGLR